MKRIAFALAVILLAAFVVPGVGAAPVAPELLVSVTPPDSAVGPGQLALIFVGGGYPLQVEGTLDGNPVPFFWNGDGYVGLVAIALEEPPGSHQLTVSAAETGGGRAVDFQTTLTVKEDPYPHEYVNIPGQLAALLDPALNQAEVERVAESVAPVSHRLEWEWPFAFPAVARITSLYGASRSYNSDRLEARHTGVDFRMPEGAPVYAAAAGRVVAAEPYDIRGNMITLDHGWGVYTRYAHLSAFKVAVGNEVEQGQLIGEAGRTGRSTGTHLHWEVVVHGVSVDPLVWMSLSPVYIQPAVDERTGQPTS